MKNQSYIGLFFGLIIMLLVAQGAISLNYLKTIANQVENLYEHSYAVSNSAHSIDIHVLAMHRYMRDIELAEDKEKILLASSFVDEHEVQVIESFDAINYKYLGDPKDIEPAYQVFHKWKKIRNEIIVLKLTGDTVENAVITRKKSAAHVAMLNKEIRKLTEFADNKAKQFLIEAVETERRAFIVILALLTITVVSSIICSIYAVRRFNFVQGDIKKRMNLIDQNILMATFDKNGVVTDISNHLCRFLSLVKKEVVGKQVNFFITDSHDAVQPQDIFLIAATGKVWEGEIRRNFKDGRVQWVESVVHPELDKNYEIQSYTNIIHDVTDRKSVEELSITDFLTGLFNRRHFDYILEQEVKLSHRNKAPLALAIIDIDYFKKFNDYYGHPQGDAVLIRVAQVFRRLLKRPGDYVFRLGGEEFGVLISGLDADQVVSFLNVIREAVEALQVEHYQSQVSDYLTISIGVHLSSEENQVDNKQLYIKSDEALYRAKKQRNAVVVL